MAKKRKPPPPETISVDWHSYQPDDDYYWFFGGPFIPPEEIPPEEIAGNSYGTGMKPRARLSYVKYMIETAEVDLPKEVAKYLDLKARGMEALDAYIREGWRQRVHTCSVKPDEADPVSVYLSIRYRQIASLKGRIIACNQALDDIERKANPLFHGKD